MKLRYLGDFDMPLRHRVFKPGDVTAFDMDDEKDALLAVKAAGIVKFFAPVVDEPPQEPVKKRGRPRKTNGEDTA